MKTIENNRGRYSASQLPVSNAPIGLAEFWSPGMENPKRDAIQKIADAVGVPAKNLYSRRWEENCLLWELHVAGNDKAARLLGTHNIPKREILLVNTAVSRITQEGEHINPAYISVSQEDLQKELERARKNLERWQNEWTEEMKNLDVGVYNDGVTLYLHTEEDRRRSKMHFYD